MRVVIFSCAVVIGYRLSETDKRMQVDCSPIKNAWNVHKGKVVGQLYAVHLGRLELRGNCHIPLKRVYE